MDQTQGTPLATSGPNPKAPIIITSISWLMFVGGIFSLLGIAPLFLLGGLGHSGSLLWLAVFTLIRGVGLIILSFGIRKMKRWALYTMTGLTVLLGVATLLSAATTTPDVDIFALAIESLVIIYFWVISKKFS